MGAELTEFRQVAALAKDAAARLAPLPRAVKDAALQAVADALVARSPEIVEANGRDLERAREAGTAAYMLDRLTLTTERVTAIADAVRKVAALPDPVGEV